jgi:hypothetical protein
LDKAAEIITLIQRLIACYEYKRMTFNSKNPQNRSDKEEEEEEEEMYNER